MRKAELLTGLHDEQRQWELLLAQIGEGRMERPGVAGDWTMKDIVAHLTGWRRRTVDRLEAARRGGPDPAPPWPAQLQSDDEINAWIYEEGRGRSLEEVLADSRQVFRRLVAAIESFPEAELMDPGRFAWLEGETLTPAGLFGHFHEEHEPDIRAWLGREAASDLA